MPSQHQDEGRDERAGSDREDRASFLKATIARFTSAAGKVTGAVKMFEISRVGAVLLGAYALISGIRGFLKGSSRRVAVGAAVLVASGAILAIAIQTSGDSEVETAAKTASSSSPVDVPFVVVGPDPVAVTYGDEFAWVLANGGDMLLKANLELPKVMRQFRLAETAVNIEYCDGVLLLRYESGYVAVRDGEDGRELEPHYRPRVKGRDLACHQGVAYTQASEDGRLSARDAETMAEVPGKLGSLPVSDTPIDVRATDQHLLAIDPGANNVALVNPEWWSIRGRLDATGHPSDAVVVGSAGYVLDDQNACVLVSDIDSGEHLGPGIVVGPNPSSMAVFNDRVYVADRGDGTLTQILADSRAPRSKAFRVTKGARIVDLVATPVGLAALSRGGFLYVLSEAELRRLRRSRGVKHHRADGCP